jgi:hypothetical protein
MEGSLSSARLRRFAVVTNVAIQVAEFGPAALLSG